MTSPQPPIKQLTPDILLHITQYLDVHSVFALSLTCHAFSGLISDERVLRRLIKTDYQITYKDPSLTWGQLYQQLQRHQISLCSHLGAVPDELPQSKQQKSVTATNQQQRPLCDTCHTNPVTFLSLSPSSDKQVCRTCAYKTEGPSSVQFNLESQSLYCFKCSREVGGSGTNQNERYKAMITLDQLKQMPSSPQTQTEATSTSATATSVSPVSNGIVKDIAPSAVDHTITTASSSSQTAISPSNANQENVDQRRKAEQLLYVQELRQEDMTRKYYLVEKSWGRAWMLFRTREGSPSPGPITNNKLSRTNGTLDPNIRIPMDKYRPAPETHADIISENLWTYLEKTYGVLGQAYSEDDIQGPEYTRLRICVNDFKHSVELYP